VAATRRYEQMRYNRVGASGLKLPAISLGLWQNFGDDRPLATQRAIIRTAFDLGITHFDLADRYGSPFGSAELNFGRVFAEDLRPYRDELVISTKSGFEMWPGPYGEDGSRKHLLGSLDRSLRSLGVDYVDIFYSHRPDPETPIEETMGALASAIQQGKALYAGISSYTVEQTRVAERVLREMGVPLLIHQPRYSMFDRRAENAGLFTALAELSVGSIVFSPLEMGLLTSRYLDGAAPPGSRASTSDFSSRIQLSEQYLARARALNEIAAARGQTLAQLALTWVLRLPQVTSALVGASSPDQLSQNVRALSAPGLTADELEAIEQFAVDGTHRS
jgi:L-glyceraldehyde 3-phosphate reductase